MEINQTLKQKEKDTIEVVILLETKIELRWIMQQSHVFFRFLIVCLLNNVTDISVKIKLAASPFTRSFLVC